MTYKPETTPAAIGAATQGNVTWALNPPEPYIHINVGGADPVVTFRPNGVIEIGEAWQDNPTGAARVFVDALVKIFPSLNADKDAIIAAQAAEIDRLKVLPKPKWYYIGDGECWFPTLKEAVDDYSVWGDLMDPCVLELSTSSRGPKVYAAVMVLPDRSHTVTEHESEAAAQQALDAAQQALDAEGADQ